MAHDITLTWVNHAGYLIEGPGFGLIADPWLSGTAFNEGWSLLAPTALDQTQYDKITHIWFSHEHPDHFSVKDAIGLFKNCPNLKEVIFQKTRDRRVAKFCEGKAVTVTELGHLSAYEFAPGCTIRIGQVGKIDSYAVLDLDGCCVVNTNDCVLSDQDKDDILAQITRINPAGRCDLLLTQFSYASYISNPDDPGGRIKAVQIKKDEIKSQIGKFKPDATIPFASFIYFSHEENFYMNDEIADIGEIAALIGETGSRACVLYPGERIALRGAGPAIADHDTAGSVQKYKTDQAAIAVARTTADHVVALDEILENAKTYQERIYKKNGAFLLKAVCWLDQVAAKLRGRDVSGFRGCTLYVHDIDQTIRFDWRRGAEPADAGTPADVSVSSDSVNYMLKFEWGLATLLVNGRMVETADRGIWRMSRVFSLGLINSVGVSFRGHVWSVMRGKNVEPIHDTEPSYLVKA